MVGVVMGAFKMWLSYIIVLLLFLFPHAEGKIGRSLLSADWYPENYTSPYRPPESDREVTVLTGPWKFHRGHVQESRPFDRYFDDSNWESVIVPHTWNAKDGQDGGDNYYRGIGWYRVKLLVSEEYTGLERRFYLQFEGAMLVTYVWVNSHFAGSHKGGFATFRIDVTNQLEIGQENSVAVLVNNAYNKDVMPLWPADFTFFGGLYRNVSLLVTNTLHVTGTDYGGPGIHVSQLNVTRELAQIQVSA
jgi:beta-galactosidase